MVRFHGSHEREQIRGKKEETRKEEKIKRRYEKRGGK
jgi:hypothetical protein